MWVLKEWRRVGGGGFSEQLKIEMGVGRVNQDEVDGGSLQVQVGIIYNLQIRSPGARLFRLT